MLFRSPNYHTAVTTFAGNALHMGHTVVCMDRWDAAETLRLIERYRCTHTHMVPTQFHRMLQLPEEVRTRYDVSSMRCRLVRDARTRFTRRLTPPRRLPGARFWIWARTSSRTSPRRNNASRRRVSMPMLRSTAMETAAVSEIGRAHV